MWTGGSVATTVWVEAARRARRAIGSINHYDAVDRVLVTSPATEGRPRDDGARSDFAQIEILVDERDGDRSFTDARGDAFDRVVPHVAGDKNPR